MPMVSCKPSTPGDVASFVRDMRAAATPFEIIGSGAMRGYGPPSAAAAVLDMSGLAGIIDYNPSELVLTARPGTPLAEVRALLAASGQHLAFEPPDIAPLWAGKAGAGTLGGALATGLSGPRRPFAGAARDHFLGFEAINGSGECFVAGGKVLKNVTGYDLPKLMAGSLGTLAIFTEVTVKALPAPAHTATLALPGLGLAEALAAMQLALGSDVTITGAAHLPGCAAIGGGPATLFRLEGGPRAVAAQADDLRAALKLLAPHTELLPAPESLALWQQIGAGHPFARTNDCVWRVSLPPADAGVFLAALATVPGLRYFLDWGGGLVWLFHPVAAALPDVRAALRSPGAQATLMRSPVLPVPVPPFQPLEDGLLQLSERVRASFDPDGLFNPGRMLPRGH
jgi:glycolate oxidase FAD binding subunit